MKTIILDENDLISGIRDQFAHSTKLKYQRLLLEFEDNDGRFLGDNVFETSFLLRVDKPPLIYEVSGPYDVVSNEYATIGRIYENGKRVFECDIKDQIQQRTAAMVSLFFDAIEHVPTKVLIVGAGNLAIETARYLKHTQPALNRLDYHARNRRTDTFEVACGRVGIAAHYCSELTLGEYDTIILVTNTSKCLIDTNNIDSIQTGAVVASLCTTSQVGEITDEIYGRDDVNVIFDYDLTRTFTPDMRSADKAGYLSQVTLFTDILNDKVMPNLSDKKNILRITGTPMQNVAVLNMMREL